MQSLTNNLRAVSNNFTLFGEQVMLKFGLLKLLRKIDGHSDYGKEKFDRWLADLTCSGRNLSEGVISQSRWLAETAHIYESVPMSELLKWIDIDKVRSQMSELHSAVPVTSFASGNLGPSKSDRIFRPSKSETFGLLFQGEPTNTEFESPEPARVLIAKVAHVTKGGHVPPHGHRNLVSAFLTISGEFHVRQYDKIEEQDHALIIRPSSDERQRAGAWSAVTDERNNVHWLEAVSDECLLFTTKIIRLDESVEYRGRINLDVERATASGGALIAPKITFEEASERY